MSAGHKTIVSLCRPPGHHCDTKMAGGYCYVNNAVIAVEAINHLHKFGLTGAETSGNTMKDIQDHGDTMKDIQDPKVAILDIDFHHGNGTQDYFYESGHVQYVSIHGENEYPYFSGNAQEVGKGDGQGFNFNYPLPVGSTAETYLKTLNEALSKIRDFDAEYLIISLGFDTYHLDPLGSFKLETKDYRRIAHLIRRRLKMPCLILLEGGYVIKDLGSNFVAFLEGWEDAGLCSHGY